jgi:hypothetical protein
MNSNGSTTRPAISAPQNREQSAHQLRCLESASACHFAQYKEQPSPPRQFERYLQRFGLSSETSARWRKQSSYHEDIGAVRPTASSRSQQYRHQARHQDRPQQYCRSRDGPKSTGRPPASVGANWDKHKRQQQPNPSPTPSSDSLAPTQPAASEFTAIPATSAGTVSQLGMRRHRQSVTPATTAGTVANIHTPCFSIGQTSSRDPGDERKQPEFGSRGLPSKCTEPVAGKGQNQPQLRIMSGKRGQVNEKKVPVEGAQIVS